MNLQTFREKPFNLDDNAITWVENTFKEMTDKEKLGQLFFLVSYRQDEEFYRHITKDLHIGGLMCRTMPLEEIIKTVTSLQSLSEIPLFIAANLEDGGNGIIKEGTKIGSEMAVAATNDPNMAYELGDVCAKEGLAVGANFAFAPVCDLDLNFRNPITNTRTFGSNLDVVKKCSKAYLKAMNDNNMLASIKHFPGDGVDERDQHLLTSINSLSQDEWDNTYGEIYKELIANDARAVMIGHIALPSYEKSINPNLSDSDVMPASLSKKLLEGLLRDRLGFKGLTITDATTMTGFNVAMPRNLAVPMAIENGCDMFLFTKNLEEDYEYMIEGYKQGILSEKRLNEAVLRILATKASINLHKKNNIPSLAKAKEIIGQDSFKNVAFEVADKSMTLVKNLDNIIPINKNKIKNILVYGLESGENALGYGRESGVTDKLINLLEEEGFNVTKFVPGDRYEGKQSKFKDMVDSYDLMLYVANLATKSNQTTVRIEWANPMGMNCPIYIKTVPTVFLSLENPYHLLDVPRIRTFINAYSCNEYTLKLFVDKLLGRSTFKGVSPIDPFCGKWDTHL